jgi:hypothetical protein
MTLTLLFAMLTSNLISQVKEDGKTCINEVVKYEANTINIEDTSLARKNIFMHYTVKATNWEEETTISNVKLYRMGLNMHFFSEQANIYMDEKDVLIVMPYQRMVVINNNNQELSKKRFNEDFFDMRRSFLDSCTVLKCELRDANHKIAVLKVNPAKAAENILIDNMVYEFDPVAGKILSVTVNYLIDYKLKQMAVFYHDISTTSVYTFPSLRSQILDKKGNVRDKYKNYEIVDSRDAKDKTKSR